MRERMPEDLDAFIASALSSETLLSAPPTLHRRVVERVRIAHLGDQQRARFRYTMATLAASVAAVFAIAGGVLWFSGVGLLREQGVSGAMGQYDYLMQYFRQYWSGYAGAYSLSSAMLLAGGALLMGIIPWWRHATRKHV